MQGPDRLVGKYLIHGKPAKEKSSLVFVEDRAGRIHSLPVDGLDSRSNKQLHKESTRVVPNSKERSQLVEVYDAKMHEQQETYLRERRAKIENLFPPQIFEANRRIDIEMDESLAQQKARGLLIGNDVDEMSKIRLYGELGIKSYCLGDEDGVRKAVLGREGFPEMWQSCMDGSLGTKRIVHDGKVKTFKEVWAEMRAQPVNPK